MVKRLFSLIFDVFFIKLIYGIRAHERADELRKIGIEMRAGNLSEPSGSDTIKKKLGFHMQAILKLRDVCREKSYDIVHVNTGSVFFQAYMIFFSRCWSCGRGAAVKNHPFLVRVFQSAAREDPSMKLLLVGGGLDNKIHNLVKSFGLEERVIFAGQAENVESYYCAMDVFAMPSLREGLPFAGIEAQTSGLYCFFSDRITKEVKVTANAQFLSIQDENLWAEKIMSVKQETPQRETAWISVRDAGWDVTEALLILRNFILHKFCNIKVKSFFDLDIILWNL